MKTKWLKMMNDERADMGIGTMIIFIAMVLVAAIAASVLITTANSVREQAQSTGEQAIRNIASGFVTQDVVGMVSNDDQHVQEVYIYMRLSAGSPAISMDNVMVSITSQSAPRMLNFSAIVLSTDWPLASSGNATKFGCERVQKMSDTPWATDSHVIGQGDMIKIYIGNTAGLLIGYSETVVIKIMPAYGQMCLVSFTTSDSFSSDYISLA